ncbi:MAG: hypothetical protein CW349_08905 [Firmicutes bacterium]|nr:hypothetical protein [Bacillota bacterium]MBO2519797.1 hypothetical protein [Bacillota bacterium]
MERAGAAGGSHHHGGGPPRRLRHRLESPPRHHLGRGRVLIQPTTQEPIRCALCGAAFHPDDGSPVCRACPLGGLIPRCGLVRCPNCGFEQPAPPQPQRERAGWTGKGGDRVVDGRQKTRITLSRLAEGERAQVVQVTAREGALAKLLAMGILPGVELSLVQAQPLPVVRMGSTTVALDRELAQLVEVAPLGPGSRPGRGGRRRCRWWRRG